MFGTLCNDSSSATLTLADSLMNDSEKRIIAARDWPFLNKQYTLTTLASTASYPLPAYTRYPQSVYVTVGSYRYAPKEVSTRAEWDAINEVVITSDIPTHYFIYDGALELFPRPATAGNTITFNARRIAKDLNVADITNLTITTLTNGSTALTTSSGLTTQMAGMWLQPTFATTTNSGDGFWYELSSVTNATTATLVRKYGGTSIAAGSAACTIAQTSLIPEPHNQLPIFEALHIFFTSVDPNAQKAQLYGQFFQEGYANMVKDFGSKVSVVLDDGENTEALNPNLHISL